MKLRFGFVSNSSSASFILKMGCLTDEQISIIDEAMGEPREDTKRYKLEVKDPGDGYSDYWDCIKHSGEIRGETYMDNGTLEEWFRELGIPQSEYEIFDDAVIDWEDYEN